MLKEVLYEDLKTIYDKGESPYRKYYGYFDNDRLIGYIVVDIIYERMEIVDVFVKEEERNKKIGTKMFSYIIELAKKLEIVNITLEVKINNTYAIKLYRHFGFKDVALRKGYYNGEDGILMELML